MGFPEVDSLWLRTTQGLLDFKRFYPNNGTLHQLKSTSNTSDLYVFFSLYTFHLFDIL